MRGTTTAGTWSADRLAWDVVTDLEHHRVAIDRSVPDDTEAIWLWIFGRQGPVRGAAGLTLDEARALGTALLEMAGPAAVDLTAGLPSPTVEEEGLADEDDADDPLDPYNADDGTRAG